MDFFTSNTAAHSDASASAMQSLPVFAAALAIWCFEARARGRRDDAGNQSSADDQCSPFEGLVKPLTREVVGLAAGAVMVALLLASGGEATASTEAEARVNEEVRKEWPLLWTADSLFALQAMLRVSILLAALRGARNLSPGPLAGQPALLFFAAGVCRVALFAGSPAHALEGPLSGWTHVAFEVVSLPLLLKLSLPALQNQQCTAALMATVLATGYAASRHRITVAEHATLDSLFTLVHFLELFAALASLARTVVVWGGPKCPFTRFTHLLLPLQQGLSLYFFLLAFGPEIELGATGRPMQMLQLGGAAQVAALLLAAALHLALAA